MKTIKINNIKSQLKLKPKVQIKRPLLEKCFRCPNSTIEVRWNRGQGKYVEKNNWGYWTTRKENNDKWICDKCLLFIYKEDKWTYLENITDEGRRNVKNFTKCSKEEKEQEEKVRQSISKIYKTMV